MRGIYTIFLVVMFVGFSFMSCDDNNSSDNSWKIENEQFFRNLAVRSDLVKIDAGSNNGFLYYKVIKSGSNDGESPKYTSSVEVAYTGATLLGFNVPADAIILGKEFDTTFKESNMLPTGDYNPATFNVNGLIEGWREALQQMKPGDKWRIYIPWELGYGSSGNETSIPEYSTLIFELELVRIVRL